MNLPNALTILRIFFVPLLVAALVQENGSVRLGTVLVTNEWVALAIFLAAAGTDLLDGYLARRWQQVTTIGTLLMWAVVVFALLSAVSYFAKFWHKVDERIKVRRRRELLTLERRRQKSLRRQKGLSRGKEGLGTATIWKPPEVN